MREFLCDRFQSRTASRTVGTLIVVVASLVSSSAACGGDEDSSVLVFAAASLVNAMAEVEEEFESRHDGSVSISYGGSQALAQQVRRGAPADLFISAGTFQTTELIEDGFVDGAEVEVLLNRLVLLVRPGGPVKSIQDLVGDSVGRVAIAEPELAPAGRYAQESLTTLGLWEPVQDKLIKGIDVRATMAYVESGNVDVAIVYKTDAAVADNAVVLDVVPPDSYSRVIYTAVLVKRPGRPQLAETFLEFLTSQAAAGVFRSFGFEPVAP